MNNLVDSLAERGFVRIHRSRGVNLDYVDTITPLESGDCDVSLKSGRSVTLSRRYREDFRSQLNQHLAGAGNA
jgi:DNA-binding LytR/AlgR family response regulator